MNGQPSDNFKLWLRKTEALTLEDWARGFEALEKMVTHSAASGETAFPPTYAEFIGYCLKPVEDIGLPSPEEAFKLARVECGKAKEFRQWPHDAIYVACQNTGFYDMKMTGDDSKSIHAVRKRFFEHYKKITDMLLAGRDIETTPKPLPKPEKQILTPESKAAGINAARSIMSMFDE